MDVSWALFDPKAWKVKPLLGLGWAVNIPPAFACSLSAVLAGCGVLKPLNMFVFGASGAWNMGAAAGFSVSFGALSLLCDAPNILLKLGAGVLAGLGSPAKRLLVLGVSGAELKRLEGAGVASCAFGVSCD